MRHIWLIGMMGTGKTTVAALVATLLGRPVVDTDAIVMESTGRTIPELFAESEMAFRDAERMAIASFAAAPASVVATGGGAVLDDRNVILMKELGTLVLLTAGIDEILERLDVAGGARPLFTDAEALVRIDAERRERYFEVADVIVDTSDKEPNQVAEEVVACVST